MIKEHMQENSAQTMFTSKTCGKKIGNKKIKVNYKKKFCFQNINPET